MEKLIDEIESYAAAFGVMPTTIVQRGGGGSGSTWSRWTSGGSCTLRVAERMRKYMAENPAPSDCK